MKTVKLIITFIIILGGVVLAFFWKSDNSGIHIDGPSNEVYETYRNQLKKKWEQQGDWNEGLFYSLCEMINKLSSDKTLQTAPLKDLNTSTAVEIVFDKIFAEWKSTTCRKNVIEKYIKAVTTIESADDNASTNPNVKRIKSVNATYNEAYSLAHKGIGLIPRFDDGSSWNSYARYSNSILSEKDATLGNSNYKEYLSDITEIKNRLNSIPDKLSEGRRRFYDSLALEIVEYYRRFPQSERTRMQLNQLRTVRSKYEEEYQTNSYLDSFVTEFSDDVERNEKQDENI